MMVKKTGLILIILIISLLLNISFALLHFFPKSEDRPAEEEKMADLSDRIVAPIGLINSDSAAVLLTIGQSNAASCGQGEYTCRNQVFEYYNERLFIAREPLLGDIGNGGCSVWTRVADMLIDSGHYRRVILISAAIGGTPIKCWTQGPCAIKLKTTLEMLSRSGLRPTHVIWHQGESDNLENTSKVKYKSSLGAVMNQIRKAGIDAPFFVCVASYHPGTISTKKDGIDMNIRQAQLEFINENAGVKPGPDTDQINLASDRYDGVHFSVTGLDKFASGLYHSLIQ